MRRPAKAEAHCGQAHGKAQGRRSGGRQDANHQAVARRIEHLGVVEGGRVTVEA